MEFKEENGRVFVNGIEYVPKENKKELPICYADVIKGSKYENTYGYFVNIYGKVVQSGFDVISTKTAGMYTNADFAKAMLTLKILLEIRDVYNGNWKPNWNDDNNKYFIEFSGTNIVIDNYASAPSNEFIFKTEELAEQFLKNHREDIEFVFKYLYMWNENAE